MTRTNRQHDRFVRLWELERTNMVDLLGVDAVSRGEGDPVVQVRIGKRGPFFQGTIVELRELALNLGISGTHAPGAEFSLPVGDGWLKGSGDDLVELGAQLGQIAGEAELEHRPSEPFINLGGF